MAIKTTVAKKEKYTVDDIKLKEKKKKTNKPKEKKKEEKKEGFLKSSITELKKVKWPSKKLTIKYTISTLVFCVIFGLFFFIGDILFLLVKGLFD